MDSGRAGFEEIFTLFRRVLDAKFRHRRVVISQFVQFGRQIRGEARAAQGSEPLNLWAAEDGNDARNQGHPNSVPVRHMVAKFIEVRIIKE